MRIISLSFWIILLSFLLAIGQHTITGILGKVAFLPILIVLSVIFIYNEK